MTNMRPSFLENNLRFVFFGGKGGVGKTTLAVASPQSSVTFWPRNGKLETFRVFRRLKVNGKPQDPVTRRISSESDYTKTAGECQEAD